ncbi:Barrier-to-autointegration factor [Varanus komodoensis]|nr:Barrier-to-autointegration factor [Varanus komodoensis]
MGGSAAATMTTSQKHRDFVAEPMGEKPVGTLAGIGDVLGKKLEDKGFDKAYVVLGQFLVLKKDEDLFREWLKDTCGANAKQSRDCYGCLREWRSNRSVLEEINPDCFLEGQILKMKLKYFGHLMRRKDSLEKTLMLGTIDGKRRRGRQRMGWLDGVTGAVGVSLRGLWGMGEHRKLSLSLEECCPWGHDGSDATSELTTT